MHLRVKVCLSMNQGSLWDAAYTESVRTGIPDAELSNCWKSANHKAIESLVMMQLAACVVNWSPVQSHRAHQPEWKHSFSSNSKS